MHEYFFRDPPSRTVGWLTSELTRHDPDSLADLIEEIDPEPDTVLPLHLYKRLKGVFGS